MRQNPRFRESRRNPAGGPARECGETSPISMPNLLIDPVTDSRYSDELPDARRRNLVEATLAVSAAVNLMLVGPDDEVRHVIGDLRPDLDGPTVVWEPGRPLHLPDPTRPGTLILRQVGEMSRQDQQRLFDWLPITGRRLRIISTAPVSPMSLTKRGAFHEPLYYRLNVVCVELG